MTQQPYNFYTQLVIGKRGEEFLDRLFTRRYDINPAYVALARKRLAMPFTQSMFTYTPQG